MKILSSLISRFAQDIVTIMKTEGHKFPPLKESDAMFKAETAPEWAEGNVCFSCRTPFSVVIRKVWVLCIKFVILPLCYIRNAAS